MTADAAPAPRPRTRATLRLRLGGDDGPALGPGKVALLEGIESSGSIAAAARAMGMAYRRAWLLVRSLNDGCGAPVVETVRGGRGRGGAVLTPLGVELVRGYRRMEARTREAIAAEVRELEARLPRRRAARALRR